jgi:hypothetical protein
MKTNWIALAVSLTISAGISGAFAANTYSDINKSWAQKDINKAVSQDFMTGYNDGMFHPDAWVSREDFVQMTAKTIGLAPDQASVVPSFSSVAQNSSGFGPVDNQAWISSYPSGVAQPENPVRRVEALSALAGAINKPLVSDAEATTILSKYQDAAQVPAESRRAVATAVQYKLFAVDPKSGSNMIDPMRPATRAEVASLLENLYMKRDIAIVQNGKLVANAANTEAAATSSSMAGTQPSATSSSMAGTQPSATSSSMAGTQPSASSTSMAGTQPSASSSSMAGTQPSASSTSMTEAQSSTTGANMAGAQTGTTSTGAMADSGMNQSATGANTATGSNQSATGANTATGSNQTTTGTSAVSGSNDAGATGAAGSTGTGMNETTTSPGSSTTSTTNTPATSATEADKQAAKIGFEHSPFRNSADTISELNSVNTSTTSSTMDANVPVTLAPGTTFMGTVAKSLYSSFNRPGDPAMLILDHPVMDANGRVIAPAGSKVVGFVNSILSHNGSTQNAQIGLTFNGLITPTGQVIPINATVDNADGILKAGEAQGIVFKPDRSIQALRREISTSAGSYYGSTSGKAAVLDQPMVSQASNIPVDPMDITTKDLLIGVGDRIQVRLDSAGPGTVVNNTLKGASTPNTQPQQQTPQP